VAYFAASCDTLETNTEFARSLELDYPILSDPECEVARAYGVVTGSSRFPSRRTFFIGTDGRILHVERDVKAREHGRQIAERLQELEVATVPGKPVP
jgi:peroxiredoxin Q/BCP